MLNGHVTEHNHAVSAAFPFSPLLFLREAAGNDIQLLSEEVMFCDFITKDMSVSLANFIFQKQHKWCRIF